MAEKAKNPPKIRPTPYSRPILLTGDRSSRRKKSLTWQSDETIKQIHYFENIPDERVNVSKLNLESQNDPNNGLSLNNATGNASGSSSSSPNANVNKLPNSGLGGKISNASVDPIRKLPSNGKIELEKQVEYLPWRPLVLIDFTPEMPSPGWNSLERSAQAERETYVLGAIDLPGQTSTLDEPDGHGAIQSTTTTTTSTTINSSTNSIIDTTKSDLGGQHNSESQGAPGTGKEDTDNVKIIPLENPEGMYTEYPDMYNSEIVNGIRMPSDNPQPIVQNMTPFCNQQSQLLPNQFQQQIINVTQNPFTFQEMSAQFHQQQFPFQQQQTQAFPQNSFAPNQTQQEQQPPQQVIQHQQPQQQQQQLQQQQQPMPFVDQQAGLTGPIMPWLNYPFNQVNENSHAHLFRRPAT